jgi:hypothetical protein
MEGKRLSWSESPPAEQETQEEPSKETENNMIIKITNLYQGRHC